MLHGRQVLIALAVIFGLAIFSDSVHAADGKVSGRVTLNGKPVADCKVFFHLESGQFVGSKTDKEGKFVVDRVPTGNRKVTLQGKFVPAKYAEEDTSPLTVSIKEAESKFELNLVE